jgi:hypothetical protein
MKKGRNGISPQPYKKDRPQVFAPVTRLYLMKRDSGGWCGETASQRKNRSGFDAVYKKAVAIVHRHGIIARFGSSGWREIPAGEYCLVLKAIRDKLGSGGLINPHQYGTVMRAMRFLNYARVFKNPAGTPVRTSWKLWAILRQISKQEAGHESL